MGMTLAMIAYFVMRAGFFSAGAEPGDVSSFGVAAVAGLVGIFSKLLVDKLNEVFTFLFKITKEAKSKQDA
jgi:hypothetical protein